jgi:hypothetical protein
MSEYTDQVLDYRFSLYGITDESDDLRAADFGNDALSFVFGLERPMDLRQRRQDIIDSLVNELGDDVSLREMRLSRFYSGESNIPSKFALLEILTRVSGVYCSDEDNSELIGEMGLREEYRSGGYNSIEEYVADIAGKGVGVIVD